MKLTGTATLIREGHVVHVHFDALLARFAQLFSGTPERLEERIYDPLVRADHDIAINWAPYAAVRGGKVDHCGTNIVSVFTSDGRCLISGIAAPIASINRRIPKSFLFRRPGRWGRLSQFQNSADFITGMNALQHSNF